MTLGAETQTREARRGYSYLSSNDPRVHFGLGNRDSVDRVDVYWQGGAVQTLENLSVNQELVVTEPLSDE